MIPYRRKNYVVRSTPHGDLEGEYSDTYINVFTLVLHAVCEANEDERRKVGPLQTSVQT